MSPNEYSPVREVPTLVVPRRAAWSGLVLAFLVVSTALAKVPFWGSREAKPPGTDPASLAPGEFLWHGSLVPSGPIVVVVSLTDQLAYVYRNGIRIGISTVSTGKPGHATPTGVFTVLQKNADHYSNLYNNAPMPYMQRLTWSGIAIHAGGLPGYPASHGCIRLPSAFANELFRASSIGMTVVIAAERKDPEEVVHPAAISPVDPRSGLAVEEAALGPDEDRRWNPEKSPKGPVAILVSAADRRVLVYRDGVEIGRAKILVLDPGRPLGGHAFTMLEPKAPGEAPRWFSVAVPGGAGEAGKELDAAQADRVLLPPGFRQDVAAILEPGATLLVTDLPVLKTRKLTILDDLPPEPAK